MNLLFILLQADAAPAGGFSLSNPLVLMGLMMVVMYFFFLRPQAKKRKEAEKFRQELQKGDSVVTIGGIHGKVSEIHDNTLTITCESGKLRIDKNAVSGTQKMNEQEVAAKK